MAYPWLNLFDFLTGNIAWTLQVRETGQDPAKVRAQLTTAVGRRAISPKTRYLPGTRLIREWQGVTHEVVVDDFKLTQSNQACRQQAGNEFAGI